MDDVGNPIHRTADVFADCDRALDHLELIVLREDTIVAECPQLDFGAIAAMNVLPTFPAAPVTRIFIAHQ